MLIYGMWLKSESEVRERNRDIVGEKYRGVGINIELVFIEIYIYVRYYVRWHYFLTFFLPSLFIHSCIISSISFTLPLFLSFLFTFLFSFPFFSLIPEEPFTLESLYARVEDRLQKKGHCVIVLAEGAGEDLMSIYGEKKVDKSGNVSYGDNGPVIAQLLKSELKKRTNGAEVNLKYIDPSYMIRACKHTAADAAFCEELGNKAVDSALSGKTGCIVGYWNERFTLVPFSLITRDRKRVNVKGNMWNTVKQMSWPDPRERRDEQSNSEELRPTTLSS